MTKVNIAEAKAHFSEILQKALLGAEIIIAKGHKPLVKLVPCQNQTRKEFQALPLDNSYMLQTTSMPLLMISRATGEKYPFRNTFPHLVD